MATFKIYKLHFTAPLHIGDQHEDEGTSQKTIQSDAFYAALTSCLAKMGHQLPEDGDLGFIISSLFPFYQKDENSNPVYFLPMPLNAKQGELKDNAMLKKVKKLHWIDSAFYGEILSGKSIFNDTEEYYSYIQGTYLTKVQLPEDTQGSTEFIRSEVSQRVTLQRRTGQDDAMPYYVDKVLFRHHAGLYFIADGNTALLEKALNILAMEGIGTDRNIGFGFFKYNQDEMTIEVPDKANYQINLSLFIPKSKEQLTELINSDMVAYDFVRRGGWITTYPYNSLRKDAIYGFLPGSVFHIDETDQPQNIGKIVNLRPRIGDLAPDHPIWRNGKAIMLPMLI